MLYRYNNIFTIIFVLWALEANALSSCDRNSSDSRSLGISVNSKKSEFGKWKDTFYATAEHSNTLSNISVDVLHNVTECSGRRIIQIHGLIQNKNDTDSVQQISGNKFLPIVFLTKHGSNVVVINNGRTIEKKSLGVDDNGVAFTNRPLQKNELFEVRLDQKGRRSTASFGIGILTKKPEDVEVPHYVYLSKFAWMYHHGAIYNEGRERRSKYGQNVDNLPVCTRFGVMKKPSGDIHFFVNGADQGSAVSGISDPVYGIVELYFNAEKVTMLEP